MLYPLKSILVKDCVKVASLKLLNRYHEFTISFAKGVGMAIEVFQSIRVEHGGCFSSVKFALRVK